MLMRWLDADGGLVREDELPPGWTSPDQERRSQILAFPDSGRIRDPADGVRCLLVNNLGVVVGDVDLAPPREILREAAAAHVAAAFAPLTEALANHLAQTRLH